MFFRNFGIYVRDIYQIFGNKVLIFFLMLVISSPKTPFFKKNPIQVPDSKMGCMPILGGEGGGGGDVGHFLYGSAVLMIAFGQIAKDPGLRPVFIHRPFCANAHAL